MWALTKQFPFRRIPAENTPDTVSSGTCSMTGNLNHAMVASYSEATVSTGNNCYQK